MPINRGSAIVLGPGGRSRTRPHPVDAAKLARIPQVYPDFTPVVQVCMTASTPTLTAGSDMQFVDRFTAELKVGRLGQRPDGDRTHHSSPARPPDARRGARTGQCENPGRADNGGREIRQNVESVAQRAEFSPLVRRPARRVSYVTVMAPAIFGSRVTAEGLASRSLLVARSLFHAAPHGLRRLHPVPATRDARPGRSGRGGARGFMHSREAGFGTPRLAAKHSSLTHHSLLTTIARLIHCLWFCFKWTLALGVAATIAICAYLYLRLDDEIRRYASRSWPIITRDLRAVRRVAIRSGTRNHHLRLGNIGPLGDGSAIVARCRSTNSNYWEASIARNPVVRPAGRANDRETSAALRPGQNVQGGWNVNLLFPPPKIGDSWPQVQLEDAAVFVSNEARPRLAAAGSSWHRLAI